MAELTSQQYPALKTELETDPRGLGLVAMTAKEAAAKLNERGASGETLGDRTTVDAWEVAACVALSEFTDAGVTAGQRQWLAMVLSAGVVDASSAVLKTGFQAIFGAGTTTRAALLALVNRPCSRGEKLFGAGVEVGPHDVQRARDLVV